MRTQTCAQLVLILSNIQKYEFLFVLITGSIIMKFCKQKRSQILLNQQKSIVVDAQKTMYIKIKPLENLLANILKRPFTRTGEVAIFLIKKVNKKTEYTTHGNHISACHIQRLRMTVRLNLSNDTNHGGVCAQRVLIWR